MKQLEDNLKVVIRYLKIWWEINKRSFLMILSQKSVIVFFLIGKILKFVLFFSFLFFLLKSSKTLVGYDVNQTVFFFLTFNLIDIISQFLFREVYRFRPLIITGDFDLILVKPINSLFRVLLGGADIIDLITLPPIIVMVIVFAAKLNPTPVNVLYYILLIVCGLIISAAFHIAVLSFAIITLEIDHTIMVYRDLTSMGRLPVDIYKEPLKGILTYLIPVGIMITLPAKGLMGFVSPVGIVSSYIFAVSLLVISIYFWKFALKKYSSASS